MNRKQFIESLGATCQNWTWSWSFVNHTERFVVFGAWDVYDGGNRSLILQEAWATSRRGNKQPGYGQSREHIRLIEEEGYRLKTFAMEFDLTDPDDDGSPAKIKGFTPEAVDKELLRIGDSWFASDGVVGVRIPEELGAAEALKEGASVRIAVNRFERNAEARRQCLIYHGTLCVVCGFDFERMYGPMGRGYIHVHHVLALAEVRKEYKVNPQTDLVPICPNCHAMIHSTCPALTVDQLREQIGCVR